MTLNREQWAIEWQRLRNVDWRDLDVKEAGGWPWLLKVLCCCLALLAALSVMMWLVVSEQREAFMTAQRQEARLLSEYRSKASQAAFLSEMRDQLATLEGQMGRLRTMLPTDAEIPSLLDSISDAAADNRLTIETIRLRPTQAQAHYVEQPLDIQVRGGYHQLARFSADIASLPRMLTQHDFNLEPVDGRGEALRLSLLARTYHYVEESDQASTEGEQAP
ncbi:type 4a pilus biogenesis protein PilO [Halomonas sp. QX-2]|jgi:type IV pilus assembly protein PilO|uniref:Type 4a pilus biogenesis protein PilO n=1 Tax=Vreelandella sedimenti TaxID=2729618 RepID=A0A7Z0N8R9_9GAMM|nr:MULTISPECIES: type 4a pilus biogenesis protein PilO [Halomonas]NYT73630.1 type 4a pilus biogenesis protein PilO [Halomonas sedimenti]|tara:strand:- start:41169 stop:41828 length:660 start_codon:yes stop_codon:yes gene_type:complete